MIVPVDHTNKVDFNKTNQPFEVIGRLLPAFSNGAWTYTELLYDVPEVKHYPEDDDNPEDYIGNPGKAAFFCYEEGACAGQIKVWACWNGYAFIHDIAVTRDHRGQGIGTQLLDAAQGWAKSKGLKGFMLETQDVNLLACRFYAKRGFHIGGADTALYANFDNADEIAIFWYKKFDGASQ